MQQPGSYPQEKRRDPRSPRAFAFYFEPSGAGRRCSAWMIDTSRGGASFLTAYADAPPLGTRLRFVEMPTCDRLVREDAACLPRYGRVLRREDGEGVTARVAVRFESEVPSEAQTVPQTRCADARVVRPRTAEPIPPVGSAAPTIVRH